MRVQIRMDTKTAAMEIAEIAGRFPNEKMTLSDGDNFKTNARSLLGNLYAQMDFENIWLETENDHYFEFKDYIIE